jgi:hypothetical protein
MARGTTTRNTDMIKSRFIIATIELRRDPGPFDRTAAKERND